MKQSRVIAVFGISGVGKSRLAQHFVRAHPNFRHVSAGGLLRALTDPSGRLSPDSLRTADPSTIVHNQFLLAKAFAMERAANPGMNFLFDGHVVIDNDRTLFPVPAEAIREIGPDLMIFVHADPAVILEQRRTDSDRARPERTVHDLDQQQIKAMATCEKLHEALGIPLSTVASGDNAGFKLVIQAALMPRMGDPSFSPNREGGR